MAIRTTIKIPNGYSYERKQEIAARIVEFIKLRTMAGFDKNDSEFKPYSLEYAKKKGVSIYDVDLKATGEMLDAMRIMRITKNEIIIGFDGRTKQDRKAEGQILGTYGQPIGNPDKVRDFLGLNAKALKEILKEFPQTAEEKTKARIEDTIDSLIDSIDDQTVTQFKTQQLSEELGINLPSWMRDSNVKS